jgi:hypothetical protein
VEPIGFEIRLQQSIDATGTPLSAVAGYLVLERGVYTLTDGTLVEAGRVAAALSGTAHALPFSRPFHRIPVVMTSVSSGNEMEPVVSRVQAVTKGGLRIDLHGGGSATPASSLVSLSYIAWEPAVDTLQGVTFEVQRAQGVGRGQWHSLVFLGAFDTPPVFLTEVQGGASGRPQTSHWDAKQADGVEVMIDTGPQGDLAHDAPDKVVGYIALR